MALGLVTTVIFFGEEASLHGVIWRFLEEEGPGRLGVTGDTRSITAVAERGGVNGDAMWDFAGKKES
jgi:hypothetical protein